MEVLYKNAKIRKLLTAKAMKGHAASCAVKDLMTVVLAAVNLKDLVKTWVRPHLLNGGLQGFVALTIDGGSRLLVQTNDQPASRWPEATSVTAHKIVDYHGKAIR